VAALFQILTEICVTAVGNLNVLKCTLINLTERKVFDQKKTLLTFPNRNIRFLASRKTLFTFEFEFGTGSRAAVVCLRSRG